MAGMGVIYGIGQTQRTDDVDDDDALIVDYNTRRPHSHGFCYRYSCLLARYPLPVFIALLVITAACGATAVLAYDLPSFDDPVKGFQARNTEIMKRIITSEHLLKDSRLSLRPEFATARAPVDKRETSSLSELTMPSTSSEIPGRETNREMNGTLENKTETITKQQTVIGKHQFCSDDDQFVNIPRIVFTPVKGGSLFTTESMRSMCHLQRTIIRNFGTTDGSPNLKKPYHEMNQCENTWSILNMITKFSNKNSCNDITDGDLADFGDLLQRCAFYYKVGLLTNSCNKQSYCHLKVPVCCLANDTVVTVFHYMTPKSFVNEANHTTFQLTSAMMFINVPWDQKWDFYMDVFEKKSINDEITKVSAINFFIKFDLFSNYLQSDALYLALGTGSAILIIVLYTGSLFITVMTILNIVMSLVVAYFVYRVIFQLSFVPFANILAVILLIGIGADDTFVFIDIWNKAKSDLPNKDRTVILHETLRHAAVTMFVTSFTTGSALYASMISSIMAIRCFSVFAGTAIMANFVFTITWLPVVVVIDDWCNERCCGWRRLILNPIKSWCRPLSKVSDKIFTSYLPWVVFRCRYIWIVVFFLLGAVGFYVVFISPKLKLPNQTDFQVFYSNHPFEKYDQVYKKQYDFEQDQVDLLPYIAVFGAVAIDNRDMWDPDAPYSSNITLDNSFDVSDSTSQEWLLNFCRHMRNTTFVDSHYGSYCFMEVVKSHMEQPCSDNLFTGIPDICCNRTDFPFPKPHFQMCAPIVCAEYGDCSGTTGKPFYVPFGPLYSGPNNTISALTIVATSTYMDGPDYDEMNQFWNTANSWTVGQTKNAPPGMRGGWFITHGWYQMYFYALQSGLALGTAESMGISLAIAALVLFLTTRNCLISLYAIISVSGTVFVTIGSLVLLGWQLNVIECVILSIAVGLSVDFSIHYGVAYRIAPLTDRKGRSEFALKTLGSAITLAALSTFVAGAMMMPASVLCYSQLGTFMMLVMATSWVYSNFFFLSLCRIIGPARNIAQIPLPKCTICKEDDTDSIYMIDADFVHGDDSYVRPDVGNSIYSPASDHLLEHVEMDEPGTSQFNSL